MAKLTPVQEWTYAALRALAEANAWKPGSKVAADAPPKTPATKEEQKAIAAATAAGVGASKPATAASVGAPKPATTVGVTGAPKPATTVGVTGAPKPATTVGVTGAPKNDRVRSARIYALIGTGKTDAEVWAIVKEEFSLPDAYKGMVRWTRWNIARKMKK
jgi:hypothetical protein